MDNFIREYELIVGGKSFKDLDFEFMIEFDSDPEPNISEIGAYNLSNDSVNEFKEGDTIIFNGGYKGNVASMIVGTLISYEQDRVGVDTLTTLTVAPGISRWSNATVNESFKSGITNRQVIDSLLGNFGLEVVEMNLVREITYDNGKVVSGMLKDVLSELSKEAGSEFYIKNEQIFIKPKEQGFNIGFLLNKDTGLIGSPRKTEEGYKIDMMLNNKVNVDTILQVESLTANGMFRVVKGTHRDGLTEVEVVER